VLEREVGKEGEGGEEGKEEGFSGETSRVDRQPFEGFDLSEAVEAIGRGHFYLEMPHRQRLKVGQGRQCDPRFGWKDMLDGPFVRTFVLVADDEGVDI
jgi:hypothetical protein